jgi:hypothetical protein
MIHPGAIVTVPIQGKLARCYVKTIHVNALLEAILDVSPVDSPNYTCPVRALNVTHIENQGKPQQWYLGVHRSSEYPYPPLFHIHSNGGIPPSRPLHLDGTPFTREELRDTRR